MLSFTVSFHSMMPDYVTQLSAAVRVGVEEGAALVAEIAKRTVPVETGSLQDTIDFDETIAGDTYTEWSVNAGDLEGGYKGGGKLGIRASGAPVDYAEAQEYGHGDSKHTPFMTPSSEEGWPDYLQVMADAIANIGL